MEKSKKIAEQFRKDYPENYDYFCRLMVGEIFDNDIDLSDNLDLAAEMAARWAKPTRSVVGRRVDPLARRALIGRYDRMSRRAFMNTHKQFKAVYGRDGRDE